MEMNLTEKSIYSYVALRIRHLRTQKNLSQNEFSQHVNLSRVSIANIEIGNQKPTLDLIWKLSSTFAVNVNYFFPVEADLLEVDGKENAANFLKELKESL